MTFDAALQLYTYPCPCGDKFEILIDDLRDGEEIAVCPSCSLMIRVIFEVVSTFRQRYSWPEQHDRVTRANADGHGVQDDLPKPDGGAGAQTVAVAA